jgi:hypothetical protein
VTGEGSSKRSASGGPPYLVGKEYFDDENRIKYKVDSVEYDAAYGAVIGYRRALDGKLHAQDDSPHLVYGEGGLSQLVDLWGIDDGEGDVRWPESDQEWAQAQRACDSTMKIISECDPGGQITQLG